MNLQSYLTLCEMCPNMEFFLVRIFPHSDMNTERYEESLRIQSECGKIRTRKNSVFGHFSRSVNESVQVDCIYKF